jgi:hypothetical protein
LHKLIIKEQINKHIDSHGAIDGTTHIRIRKEKREHYTYDEWQEWSLYTSIQLISGKYSAELFLSYTRDCGTTEWYRYILATFAISKSHMTYSLSGQLIDLDDSGQELVEYFQQKYTKIMNILQEFLCNELGLADIVMRYIHGNDVWDLMFCEKLALS